MTERVLVGYNTQMTTLEPGPELDALVAEKVMGWEVTRRDHPMLEGGEQVIHAKDADGALRAVIWDIANYPRSLWWHPSTDITAAWEVVEKVWGNMAMRWDRPDGKVWVSGIPAGFWHKEVSEAVGETAPHAICLAALKAVALDRSGLDRL